MYDSHTPYIYIYIYTYICVCVYVCVYVCVCVCVCVCIRRLHLKNKVSLLDIYCINIYFPTLPQPRRTQWFIICKPYNNINKENIYTNPFVSGKIICGVN